MQESRLARLPGIRQRGHRPGRWRWLLPYMPRYFEHLDLRGYELVVSSSHACAAGVRTGPDTLHACYCHTPMRYVWMPTADRGRVRGLKGAALAALRGRLRDWDRRAAQRPDVYVANSSAVAERIANFYDRPAEVVPPPVAVGDFPHDLERDPTRFLWVHRLVPYKRPLEVANAFRGLPDLRLTMVGVGPLEDELRAGLPHNVELLGWLPRDRLARLFAQAGGFIHVGEEDFGISMVEALAAGTPVLAADHGGARDIVRPGRDGALISDPTDPEQIRAGVQGLAGRSWERGAAPAGRALLRGALQGTPHGGAARPRRALRSMDGGPRIVAIAFHETAIGGASQSILRVLPGLIALGWRFTAWTPGPGSLREELEAKGLPVAGEPRLLRLSRQSLLEPPGTAARLASVPRYLTTFRSWVRRVDPALLHANTLIALPEIAAARGTGSPTLLHVHETLSAGPKGRAAALLMRFAADVVVGISVANVSAMRQHGLEPLLVPNGVPLPPERRPPRSDRRLVIGILGTISSRKGSDVFVAAAQRLSRRLPDAEFRMIGACVEGPERSWAKRVASDARRTGVHVGRCADPYSELSEWDVLVAPSRDEPFGLVAAEAMASGIPVVATQVGGLPEVVGPDAALLVPPDDPEALADAILELGRDGALRASLGAAGRRRAETHFSLKRQAVNLHYAYRAALGIDVAATS